LVTVIFTRHKRGHGCKRRDHGAYLKLYEFITNPLTVSLYATGVWYNPGYPRAWVNALYQKIGPFPRLASVSGVTTDQDTRDFSHREDDFFRDAALNVLRQPDWDMVITYQSIVDNFEHAYLLTDPPPNILHRSHLGHVLELHQGKLSVG